MLESKPQPTPMVSSLRLAVDDSVSVVDPTLYRSVVGALQYVTLTRPDSPSLLTKCANTCTIHNSHIERLLNVSFATLQVLQHKVYVFILVQATPLLVLAIRTWPLIRTTTNPPPVTASMLVAISFIGHPRNRRWSLAVELRLNIEVLQQLLLTSSGSSLSCKNFASPRQHRDCTMITWALFNLQQIPSCIHVPNILSWTYILL